MNLLMPVSTMMPSSPLTLTSPSLLPVTSWPPPCQLRVSTLAS